MPKVSEPVWQFEHSVETGASRQFAWKYWTNVGNWVDPPAEFRIEEPLCSGFPLDQQRARAGSLAFSDSRGSTADGYEYRDAACGSGLALRMGFDELPAQRTRITQRLSLAGENAAYRDKVVIFESSVPEGMKRLATVWNSGSPHPSGG